jgi:hypothetical protein
MRRKARVWRPESLLTAARCSATSINSAFGSNETDYRQAEEAGGSG